MSDKGKPDAGSNSGARDAQGGGVQMKFFKRGDQVAYVPGHALGNISHSDTERGFVIEQGPKLSALCRFWRRDAWGVLRTTANGEWVNLDNLTHYQSGPQSAVQAALDAIETNRDLIGVKFSELNNVKNNS